MSRTLKRVPMDFDWPINKVWDGYVMSCFRKCPDCENGSTMAGERLQDLVRLIMLSGEDAQRGECHPYFNEMGGLHHSNGKVPSKDMLELTVGLAGRDISPFGHDSADRCVAVRKIVEAAGLDPKAWGVCPTCKGHATDPAVKAECEAWKPTDPPTGEGFQLWENISEGSPQSPVFATLDELCEWATNHATTFASYTASAEEWKRMLSDNMVCHREGNIILM
jgi:hypothetical protein